MVLLRLALVLVTMVMFYQAEGCQPELVEDAASLVTVGYDRQRNTAMYVDTLSVDMKKKKKFATLLTSDCNGRRDATVAIEIRKVDSEEWEEKARDIKITAKHYDDIKNLDPCTEYEIRVLIRPTNGGEVRELPIFVIGPYYELDPKDIAIAKFKGDGEQYYKENFKAEYIQVTDNSFTVKWDSVCALGINVFVKDEEQEDWDEAKEKKISNNMKNPTTEVTFDVPHCKVFEVIFEFAIDSAESQEIYERELHTVTSDPNKKVLKSKFEEAHKFNNMSTVLEWDFTHLIDEFDCIESFSYKLIKDENGDLEQLLDGNYDSKGEDFNVSSVVSECNFEIQMNIEYETVENHVDSLVGFEEHIHKKDQKDNTISVHETNIIFEVNPCGEPDTEIVIGLSEISREGRELSTAILESNLAGQVAVNKSMTDIQRSDFDAVDLKSCVAYKIMLLRRSNQEFKELDTAEFENPKWDTWAAPTILQTDNTSDSLTMELTDNETGGECFVRHYDISCTDMDGEDTKKQMFQPNEELKLENLSAETEYNCTGRIVHTIPGVSDFETPWSDAAVFETSAAPLPEPTTTVESETETSTEEEQKKKKADDNNEDAVVNMRKKSEALEKSDSSIIIAVSIIAIIVVIVLAGGCYWWRSKKVLGSSGKDADVNLSYRASATAGTKVVEMNSSVLTDTEEDTEKDIETAKTDIKETAVDIPEENLATTSTGGTPTDEAASKVEPETSPELAHVETSRDAEIKPKEPIV